MEFLKSAQYTNGMLQLNAMVSPNRNYQVQVSTNLVNWTPYTNVSTSGFSISIMATNPPGTPYQFFRGISQ
jgi:hypothetical protein